MMMRRPLGHTSQRVTPIGMGLAALGRPGYITLGHAADLQGDYSIAAMQAHTHAMLDFAWDAGIRYFDAARSYGRAEEFLGTWLAGHSFDADDLPVIGSKWGYAYTAGWNVEAEQHEVKDHTLPLLQRQWQESQKELGSFLNLYQIHSATLESGVLSRAEVLAELAAIKQRGTLIGLSLSGANQNEVLAVALEVTIEGLRLFDTVQATWNLLEPSCGPMLQSARERGLGVIIKEVFANGRLTTRNQEPGFAPQLARLTAIAKRHAATIDALALAAALAQPWADVTLSGAATPKQLQSNLAALQIALTPADWEELNSLAESPQTYWATRSRLAWN
ncbi:MAG: aldo/keto reductase [Caldilineaceae bacterium]|nr:aldo/keto reductase [Caldilineaceae bacterium]